MLFLFRFFLFTTLSTSNNFLIIFFNGCAEFLQIYSFNSKFVFHSVNSFTKRDIFSVGNSFWLDMQEALEWIKESLEESLEDRDEESEEGIAIVPLTAETSVAMESPSFQRLIRAMGIEPPALEQAYWRIPASMLPATITKRCTLIEASLRGEFVTEGLYKDIKRFKHPFFYLSFLSSFLLFDFLRTQGGNRDQFGFRRRRGCSREG